MKVPLEKGDNVKALVIEDAMFLRELSKTLLKKSGCEIVEEAGDGEEGLNKYKELNPDLVLLDISMPKVSGVDCLKAIREYDEDAKVIICSSFGKENIVREAIKLGAIDFIVKPYDSDEFMLKIKKILDEIKNKSGRDSKIKMRVLVIEDSEVLRQILNECIEKADCEMIGDAENGEEGVRKYKKLKPDLVLMDISMPKRNGLDCLRTIIKYDKKAKVIVCSAHGKKDLIQRAIRSGAIDYIKKPFAANDVIQKLKIVNNRK